MNNLITVIFYENYAYEVLHDICRKNNRLLVIPLLFGRTEIFLKQIIDISCILAFQILQMSHQEKRRRSIVNMF